MQRKIIVEKENSFFNVEKNKMNKMKIIKKLSSF